MYLSQKRDKWRNVVKTSGFHKTRRMSQLAWELVACQGLRPKDLVKNNEKKHRRSNNSSNKDEGRVRNKDDNNNHTNCQVPTHFFVKSYSDLTLCSQCFATSTCFSPDLPFTLSLSLYKYFGLVPFSS